jgi:hypothetical protein
MRNSVLLFSTLLTFGVLTSPIAADPLFNGYPDTLVSATPASFTSDAQKLLGAPDNDIVVFSDSTEATYGAFGTTISYDRNSLASLIDVSLGTLADADFIAFDANGVDAGAGQFETSVWTFDDGTTTLVHNHDFFDGSNGPVLANNELVDVGSSYNSLFGTSFANGQDFGVILFDLSDSGIDTANPNFEVTLRGGGTPGTGAPDVTLLAITNAVPEPSSLALLATGVVGLLAYRRRQRKLTLLPHAKFVNRRRADATDKSCD